MANFLVTGGAGFIGSNIVEELVKRGEKVRVIDNFSTGKRENILPFLDKIELIEGDIRSYHIVRDVLDGVDFILHQAALPSVPRSINDPITTNDVNVGGTLNVLNSALDAKVKRIVYASSSSIYGNSEVLPKREDMTPNPMSPYAVSKLAGEKYCQVFSQIYGLETVCFRYFNVFGPHQDPISQYSAVIPRFINSISNGQAPIIFGDGEQSRDFTYVQNVVEANLLFCQEDNPELYGKVINIACGNKFTINELIEEINRLLCKRIKPVYDKIRPGDVRHSFADITTAKKILGYIPKIDFDKGLKMTIEFQIYNNIE